MRIYLRLNLFSVSLLIVSLLCIAMLIHGQNNVSHEEWRAGKEFLLYLREEADFEKVTDDIRALEGPAGEINQVQIPSAVVPHTPADNSAAEEFSLALELLKKGELPQAEKALAAFLHKNPDHSDGWRHLGDCHYNTGKIDAAIDAYKTALRKDAMNYLAKRGLGVAALYLGYEFYEQDNIKLAHRYFQQALQNLHDCLERNNNDQLAAYGQALAAEGVSRELYRIAQKALHGENEETAKTIIRNCLDILDVAVTATEDRLARRPEDNDARMLLGGLLVRRARMLQPFGHVEEASDNLMAALRAYAPVIKSGGAQAGNAKAQTEICSTLIREWNHN